MAKLAELHLFNTFGRFVRMNTMKKYVVCLVLLVVSINNALGQHYFFIEADGGQPFYVKKADTLFSSNALGFIILSRNYQSELTFSIGFPQHKYPEIVFSLSAMDHDRGFQLKKLDQKGWVLFDRETFEIFESNLPVEVKKPEIAEPVGRSGSEFGNMLAEVTDDKTLLDNTAIPISDGTKLASVDKSPDKKTTSSLGNAKNNVAAKPLSLSRVRLLSQDTSGQESAKFIYVDQLSSKKSDTVQIEIEYPISKAATSIILLDTIHAVIGLVPGDTIITDSLKYFVVPTAIEKDTSGVLLITSDLKVPESESSAQDSVKAIRSEKPATTKAIRRVLKKLLGISAVEDQFSYLQKIYTNRQYTTSETKEIGWFFVSEEERLRFFQLAVQSISDIENVHELQHVFLKEESLKAFKESISNHF
jgi:hypothetical protein